MWPPPSIPVANEGLGWDSLLKMVHNPGAHWNPARGQHPTYTLPGSLTARKNPGKRCLEDDPFQLGPGNFSEAILNFPPGIYEYCRYTLPETNSKSP